MKFNSFFSLNSCNSISNPISLVFSRAEPWLTSTNIKNQYLHFAEVCTPFSPVLEWQMDRLELLSISYKARTNLQPFVHEKTQRNITFYKEINP
jgi:hypothetical protein